jgi:hypothetical protein
MIIAPNVPHPLAKLFSIGNCSRFVSRAFDMPRSIRPVSRAEPSMIQNDDALEIYCDESGSTGSRLLDENQRVFSYASVAISDGEAFAHLSELRRKHQLPANELKASWLLRHPEGTSFLLSLLNRLEGRYSVVLYDKLFALCAKVFEYLFEPVFPDAVLKLLYGKKMHLFVAMYCYHFFQAEDASGEPALRQFEKFMRTLDPSAAPILFAAPAEDGAEDPFAMILNFARNNRRLILADNIGEAGLGGMPDSGQWTLDVALPALWSLLTFWGAKGRPLKVICDHSRPLEAQIGFVKGGPDDVAIQRIYELFEGVGELTFELAVPVEFADSRNRPALQVADLIAGTASACLRRVLPEATLAPLDEVIEPHIYAHSVLPDPDYARIYERGPMINWIMLQGLSQREFRGPGDYFDLDALYEAVEAQWDHGGPDGPAGVAARAAARAAPSSAAG